MPSIDGLITGLDTGRIIEGMLSVQQSQIERIGLRRQNIVDQQTAFKAIEARLLTFRGELVRVARSGENVFKSRTVTSSDEAAVQAAVSSKGVPGVYQLHVDSLARAHQVASQGFASADAEITTGELVLQLGSGAATTIVVDSNNNTLQDLARSINDADTGISATVVNDGTSSETAYRLLLTSQKTGAANEIQLTNNLDPSGGDAVRPEFDFLNPVQAASNASIRLGSGPGAITVQSDTNRIDEAIPGVTLNLLAADPDKEITITVSRDVEAAREAVTEFVNSYNELIGYVDKNLQYDPETDRASVLFGNYTARHVQNELRSQVVEVVSALKPEMNRLSALGIRMDSSGRLITNSAKLDDALNGRIEGVTMDDVARVFSLDGTSTNSNIEFVLGSSKTKASPVELTEDGTEVTPFQVDITAAAERATITATNALAESTAINDGNNELTITIDGKTTTLQLANGTYTRDELAEHLQTLIEQDDTLGAATANVAVSNDRLKITSTLYGSSSEVTIGDGSAQAALGMDGSESDRGQDVVGSFIVDGETESAEGRGRLLVGDSEDGYTRDLQVRVNLTSSQVQAGVDGEITVTRGIAARLDETIGKMVDPTIGAMSRVNDEYNQRLESIDASIDRLNTQFEAQRERLVREFAALESAVAKLQSSGNFLAGQLGGLSL